MTSIQDELRKINNNWIDVLSPLLEPYAPTINSAFEIEQQNGYTVLPSINNVFNAFRYCDINDIKVVIIGQDCYYSRGKNGCVLANGLCFSVSQECHTCPSSLKTIFKELQHEYSGELRKNTDLTDWAKQGVLLLNCALTVREGKAGSHMKLWKNFTEQIIKHIATKHEHVVYILWGEHAKSYAKYINKSKNLVLECRHPSGLASSKGPFVGNNHFKLTNEYLANNGKCNIQWV